MLEQILAEIKRLRNGKQDEILATVKRIETAIFETPPDQTADQEAIDALTARLKVANESLVATVAAHQITI